MWVTILEGLVLQQRQAGHQLQRRVNFQPLSGQQSTHIEALNVL
jgi:hypothetical protein